MSDNVYAKCTETDRNKPRMGRGTFLSLSICYWYNFFTDFFCSFIIISPIFVENCEPTKTDIDNRKKLSRQHCKHFFKKNILTASYMHMVHFVMDLVSGQVILTCLFNQKQMYVSIFVEFFNSIDFLNLLDTRKLCPDPRKIVSITIYKRL